MSRRSLNIALCLVALMSISAIISGAVADARGLLARRSKTRCTTTVVRVGIAVALCRLCGDPGHTGAAAYSHGRRGADKTESRDS